MKKRTAAFTVTGLVGILAAAYVGATWYVGQQAEDEIHAMVQQYNQQAQQYLADTPFTAQLSIADYQRGVFSSNVRYKLQLGKAQSDTTVRFADHLVHGPLPYSEVKRGHLRPLLLASNTRVLLSAAQRNDLPQPADAKRPLAYAHTTLQFSGAGQSVWHIQPLHDAQGQFAFSGGTLTLTLPGTAGAARVAAAFADLKIDQSDGMQHWQDFALHGQMTPSAAATMTAQLELSAASMTSRNALGLTSKTEDWSLQFDMQRANGQLDAAVDYRAGDSQLGSADLGRTQLSGHVSHVDVTAWQMFLDMMIHADSDSPAPVSDAHKQQVMAAFLASSPVVAVDTLQWQTANGQSTASLVLQLQPPASPGFSSTYAGLLGAIDQADVEISLSRPMLSQFLSQYGQTVMTFGRQEGGLRDEFVTQVMDDTIGKLTRYGLAKENGDSLQSSIHYQDNAVTLNDEELSVKEFVGRMFMTWLGFR